MLYATSGRFDEALGALAQAYRADVLWPVLPAMEVLIRLCRREFDSAVACGKKAVELHPYLHAAGSYAQALEFTANGSGSRTIPASLHHVPGPPWIRAYRPPAWPGVDGVPSP